MGSADGADLGPQWTQNVKIETGEMNVKIQAGKIRNRFFFLIYKVKYPNEPFGLLSNILITYSKWHLKLIFVTTIMTVESKTF